MLDTLEAIYQNTDNPFETRLAAIDKAQKIMSRRPSKRKRNPKKDRSLANDLAAIRRLQNEKP